MRRPSAASTTIDSDASLASAPPARTQRARTISQLIRSRLSQAAARRQRQTFSAGRLPHHRLAPCAPSECPVTYTVTTLRSTSPLSIRACSRSRMRRSRPHDVQHRRKPLCTFARRQWLPGRSGCSRNTSCECMRDNFLCQIDQESESPAQNAKQQPTQLSSPSPGLVLALQWLLLRLARHIVQMSTKMLSNVGIPPRNQLQRSSEMLSHGRRA